MSKENDFKSCIEIIVKEIAHDEFGIDTLETQNSDSLDFHNISVWQIKSALENAFKTGFESGVNFKGK